MTTRSQKMAVFVFCLGIISGCTNEQPVESTKTEVRPGQPPETVLSNSPTQQIAEPTPELNKAEIIEAHVRAVGGSEAIRKIKSIIRVSEVTSRSAAGEAIGTTTEVLDLARERGRVDTDLGEFKQAKGWAGEQGWRVSTLEPLRASTFDEVGIDKIVVPVSIVQAISGAFGTEAFRSIEKVQFNGKPCFKLTIVEDPLMVYLDASTKLIEGLELEKFMVIYLGDYKEVEGVQMPHYSKTDITVLQTSFVSKVQQVNFNREITDDQLAKPAK
ncbi:MAG: hypothetical protein VX776_03995 [Planctomycetota bacterium]|nr:hypothetical protein [Planctomycetota bacterium]